MSNPDLLTDGRRLEQSFRTTAELLRSLLAAMQAHRTAWAAARPSRLQPPPELETLGQRLQDEERQRQQLLERMAAAMPRPAGVAAADLHLNVTRIAASLPPPAGRTLRAAADVVTGLARQVRTEVALGQRLLRFTARAQEGLLSRLAAEGDAGIHGYDRRARAMVGLPGRVPAGRLLDGRV